MPAIGWFGSDLVDDVGDGISDGWNAVVDTVPGARDVVNVVDSVLVGPVRDFAQTGVGRALLTTLASSVTGGLAPLLGPQLATIAFAIPGMAAGEDFVTSWTQEFGSRVQQTAQIMGADVVPAEWGDQLKKATDYINQYDIPWDTVDFHTLAKWAGIREDVAAWVVAGATGKLDDFRRHIFDPKTGKDQGIGLSLSENARRAADKVVAYAISKRAHDLAKAHAQVASTDVGFAKRALYSELGFSAPTTTIKAAPTLPAMPALVRSPAEPRTSTTGNVMLGVVIVAAVGALAYYFMNEK